MSALEANAADLLRPLLPPESILLGRCLDPEHKLHRLFHASLDALTVSKPGDGSLEFYWSAERYGLHRSRAYMALSEEKRTAVLKRLSDANLGLSYAIETSGLNYGAKMILLSETLEEKSVYALFVAEEAIHRREFSHFLGRDAGVPAEGARHPMLAPLARAIERGSRDTLLFVVQVLLEGFGMSHYHGLGEQCLDEALREAYRRILRDEARHHGTGLVLFETARPSAESRDEIFEYSLEFIRALQEAGWILAAVENESGPLSSQERAAFFEDIQWESQLAARAQKIRETISRSDRIGLVERLDREGAFKKAGSLPRNSAA